MMRRNELAGLLEGQTDFSKDRNQARLLDQLECYLKVTKQERDTETKANIKKGSCRAFSLLNGFMWKRKSDKWWNTLMRAVCEWDGHASSLDKVIDTKRDILQNEVMIEGDLDAYIDSKKNCLHNGRGFPAQLPLRIILKIVNHNVMLLQSRRSALVGGYGSGEKYRFGAELEYRTSNGEHVSFGRGSYIAGNFDLERFKKIVSHESFQEALDRDNTVCLVYSNNHACELSRDQRSNTYRFFNPNTNTGKNYYFGPAFEEKNKISRIDGLFLQMEKNLGNNPISHKGHKKIDPELTIDLAFEMVKLNDSDLECDPFQGYADMVQENPFNLLAFNNRRDQNFASELYICDQQTRFGLTSAMSDLIKATDKEGLKKVSPKKNTMINLLTIAFQKSDIQWLAELLENVNDQSVVGKTVQSKLKDAELENKHAAGRKEMMKLIKRRETELKGSGLAVTARQFKPKKTDQVVKSTDKLNRNSKN